MPDCTAPILSSSRRSSPGALGLTSSICLSCSSAGTAEPACPAPGLPRACSPAGTAGPACPAPCLRGACSWPAPAAGTAVPAMGYTRVYYTPGVPQPPSRGRPVHLVPFPGLGLLGSGVSPPCGFLDFPPLYLDPYRSKFSAAPFLRALGESQIPHPALHFGVIQPPLCTPPLPPRPSPGPPAGPRPTLPSLPNTQSILPERPVHGAFQRKIGRPVLLLPLSPPLGLLSQRHIGHGLSGSPVGGQTGGNGPSPLTAGAGVKGGMGMGADLIPPRGSPQSGANEVTPGVGGGFMDHAWGMDVSSHLLCPRKAFCR